MNFFKRIWNKIYEKYIDFVMPSEVYKETLEDLELLNCRCMFDPVIIEEDEEMTRDYPKSELGDAETFLMKDIVDEIIDRSGKVEETTIKMRRGGLEDILKSLDERNFDNFFNFNLEYDGEFAVLKLGGKLE